MTVGILDQVKTAQKHPGAAVLGLLLGGGVPLAIYFYARELGGQWRDPRAAIVAGGLLFSAKTVWQWGRQAFDCPYKATGYVVLMEGVMVTSQTELLSRLALAFLIGINAIATACTIATEKQAEPEAPKSVTEVARALSLPRAKAAKVVDQRLAAAKRSPA